MLAHADSAQRLQKITRPWRDAAERIALVPTMGNLHQGHLSLCTQAAKIADRVIVSIFVNPTQFGENEDFDSYPRTLDEDIAALGGIDVVDAVFVPSVAEIYPHGLGDAARVTMPPLSRDLCGASRPGHFDGVAGVVLRLLNVTAPGTLVLGEKDYQQLTLMRWLVEDLRLPVDVIGMPIERAADGLALSSRNKYLDAAQREQAPALNRALREVAHALAAGGRDFEALEKKAAAALDEQGFRTEYVQVRNAMNLQQPQSNAEASELIVLGAAWLGKARLIDNVRV